MSGRGLPASRVSVLVAIVVVASACVAAPPEAAPSTVTVTVTDAEGTHTIVRTAYPGIVSQGGPGPGMSSGTGAPPPSGSTTSGTNAAATGKSWTVPRSVHEDAWLCQTAVTVDDYDTSPVGGLSCKVSLSFTDSQVTMTSTGIPNHDFESGGGCCAVEGTLTQSFPLKPTFASSVTYTSTRGAIAYAVNGAAMYGPEDSDSQDVVVVTRSSPTATPRLELCDAHSDPQGHFHYHADANCIHWHPDAGQDMRDYSFNSLPTSEQSKIIGFAFDGFPIYGSFGNVNGTVRELTSSYQLKVGKTGSGGIADYEYVEGLGDLDECNGREMVTPEFPDGIYAYATTLHNGAGALGFPYFPLCYKGVVQITQTMGGGGGGGMQPSGGGGGGTQSGGSMGPSPTGSTMPPPTGQSPPPGGGSMPPPPGGGGGSPPPPPPGG